jgi:hypothetical protein
MKNLTLRLSAAMWARVLVLWLILAVGSLVVGGIAVGMGKYIQDNVHTVLSSQQISFSTADKMADVEKAIPGMVDNAGLPLTTGNQAQVYSNLIALHIKEAADNTKLSDGKTTLSGATYATLGSTVNALKATLATVTKAGDATAIAAAQSDVDKASGLRATMLTGNTLIGTLLSAYGWDNVGTGVTIAGIAIMVLAVVFFVLFIFEWRRGHLPAATA